MARIVIPLPDFDFDITEVAVPWKVLTRSGHDVVFATENGGAVPEADPLLFDGVIFGKLGAEREPIQFYRELEETHSFRAPTSWKALDFTRFDAVLLPGGHAPRMRQYLGSESLHRNVALFAATGRPLAAICHGVIVLARAHGQDGSSVIAQKNTTCLPKYMERAAYYLTAWKRGSYYRTYPEYVEDEVRRALAQPERQFMRGPFELSRRGTDTDDSAAFVVLDGNYLSARWPGDAYLFAKRLLTKLA